MLDKGAYLPERARSLSLLTNGFGSTGAWLRITMPRDVALRDVILRIALTKCHYCGIIFHKR